MKPRGPDSVWFLPSSGFGFAAGPWRHFASFRALSIYLTHNLCRSGDPLCRETVKAALVALLPSRDSQDSQGQEPGGCATRENSVISLCSHLILANEENTVTSRECWYFKPDFVQKQTGIECQFELKGWAMKKCYWLIIMGFLTVNPFTLKAKYKWKYILGKTVIYVCQSQDSHRGSSLNASLPAQWAKWKSASSWIRISNQKWLCGVSTLGAPLGTRHIAHQSSRRNKTGLFDLNHGILLFISEGFL